MSEAYATDVMTHTLRAGDPRTRRKRAPRIFRCPHCHQWTQRLARPTLVRTAYAINGRDSSQLEPFVVFRDRVCHGTWSVHALYHNWTYPGV